jgi:hypothetical protein
VPDLCDTCETTADYVDGHDDDTRHARRGRLDLHRYWRNARTHSVHDPVDWKYHHLGGYEPADVLPPNHGQL